MIKWFKKFIERLAKSNNEMYGGEKLECCTMNKQEPKKVK